jgi:pyruvate/2-oxoglutarate dehydrogenase complex dihydrolipoamide dehydrogenase (E3) component/uncharacterized membrane protein YdjX (TVP38/TMEM64 family)
MRRNPDGAKPAGPDRHQQGVGPSEVTMATIEQAKTPPRTGGRGRLIGLALAVVALVVLFRVLPVDRWLLDFVAWIRGAGAAGMAVFVAAYVVATVLFLPGSILTLGAGFAYGVGFGTPLVWVAANLGATLAFLLGRTLARDAIARRVTGNPRFAAIDQAVGREGLKIVLLTRLSPVFPFNLLNYAYGLTRVSLRDYLIGSLVGMVPGTLMYVYLGSLVTSLTELTAGRTSGGTAQQALYFLGLAATIAVTVVVTRVARRALDQATRADVAKPAAPASDAPAYDPEAPLVLPDDQHNRELLRHLHPRGRVDPQPSGRYNLVVVGGGTAGLVSAAGGAGLGARVALVERHLLGGDCLNVGCVPSKALIAAARAASSARRADALGVRVSGVEVDFPAVMERMRRLRAKLAPIDGVERFTGLGVDVFLAQGRFTGPTHVLADGRTLEFSRAVVATGARAAAPDVPGLADVDYLTNENLFWLTELPRRLVVVGAGPIGCEMAQTFRAFGAEVTVIHADAHVLPREDADAAAVVERRLGADGVRLVHGAHLTRVERANGEIVVHYEDGGTMGTVRADRLLVGIGRAPNLEGLGLEAAGIEYDQNGVRVDDHLRTTNPRVYAAGDISSPYKFTHTADAAARIVLTNALFAGRRTASALTIPWCTYTTPEVARVGLSEHDAAARGIAVQAFTIPLAEVDRALLDGEDEGFLRVLTEKGSDRIVGATLVATHAGDMISELTVAMVGEVGLGTIANIIHPYPTQAEAIRKAGDAYNRTRLTPLVKRLFRTWLRMRR